MSEVSMTVLINKRKTFEGAFTDPDMVMYLPVNGDGDVVCATEAQYLEAWTPQLDAPADEIPRSLARNDLPISHALLMRNSEDKVFGTLTASVAFRGIKVMNEWLHRLKRNPDLDMRDVTVYYAS